MKNKIQDLFNVAKYKRKYNKVSNSYTSLLESRIKDKEEKEELYKNILAAKDKIESLTNQLDCYKQKYGILENDKNTIYRIRRVKKK